MPTFFLSMFMYLICVFHVFRRRRRQVCRNRAEFRIQSYCVVPRPRSVPRYLSGHYMQVSKELSELLGSAESRLKNTVVKSSKTVSDFLLATINIVFQYKQFYSSLFTTKRVFIHLSALRKGSFLSP